MLKNEDRILTKSDLKEWLSYEKKLYPCSFVSRALSVGEAAVLYKHQVLLRKTEYYLNSGNKILFVFYRYFLRKLQLRHSLHIPTNCCGKGLHIMHVGPILMNNCVTVGENCTFHINTALVAGGTNDDVPILGKGVIVGCGAIVLGGVNIANNVAIGANAVVNKDCLEENVAIAGVPARIISRNGSLEWNKKAKKI